MSRTLRLSLAVGIAFELLLFLSIPIWPHEGDVPAMFPLFAALAPVALFNWLRVPAPVAYTLAFLLMAAFWTSCAYFVAAASQSLFRRLQKRSLTRHMHSMPR